MDELSAQIRAYYDATTTDTVVRWTADVGIDERSGSRIPMTGVDGDDDHVDWRQGFLISAPGWRHPGQVEKPPQAGCGRYGEQKKGHAGAARHAVSGAEGVVGP